MEQPHPQPLPQILSPCSTSISGTRRRRIRRRRRRNSDTNSPEFEFCMLQNPSFPQPNLLSADELFSDGFVLPLHLLQISTEPPPPPPPPEPSTTEPVFNNSKRWRHLFKKNDQSKKEKDAVVREKREKREKKNSLGAGKVVSAAELNINIWPFSRSRSAGNGGARPRAAAATRKVSSAPCSRSNSTGDESKGRKWAHNSPNRGGGVHLGRNSPVWHLQKGGGSDGRRKITAPKARVPMCIGYRNHLSCRHDETSVAAADDEVIRKGSLFNIRTLFTKRLH